MLYLLGLDIPNEMDGNVLIEKNNFETIFYCGRDGAFLQFLNFIMCL